MKKIFITLLFSILFAGCTTESPHHSKEYPVIIQGKLCNTFFSEKSRTVSSEQSLPELSTISFFSSGGLYVDGSILTYSGTNWQGELPKKWEEEEIPAHILAYHPPVLSDNQFIYNEKEELQDILIAQQTIPYGQPIQLSFNHLFSQISFSVSPELNQTLEKIEFTPSVSISHINPETSEITYDNQIKHTIFFEQKEDGIYSFIIPPYDNLSIDITLVTLKGRIQTTLPSHSFSSGYSYNCLIKTTEGNIGIYTSEDFIAFTQLINGNEYKGRSLEEFGTTQNGVTTYYLQNDLTFSEAQCAELLDIGWIKTGGHELGFKDIFDGQNHTLSNIILSTFTYRLRTGLFGFIDETGVVKNLHLSQISYSSLKNKCSMTGLLCGENRGLIDGCRVTNSLFNTTKSTTSGGIAGINKGFIINCSVEQTEFSFEDGSYGGISNINMKGILNCFTEQCSYKGAANGAGICNEQRDGGYIENCFTHNNNYPKAYGALIYKGNGGRISKSYHPNTVKAIGSGQIENENIFSYNPTTYITTDNSQSLLDLLNQWIDNEGISKYPSLSFYHWKQGDNSLIIHIRP